jgi:hypothetical protein
MQNIAPFLINFDDDAKDCIKRYMEKRDGLVTSSPALYEFGEEQYQRKLRGEAWFSSSIYVKNYISKRESGKYPAPTHRCRNY